MSVISEAFNCPPDVAERQDRAQCLRILALRRYRDVKQAIESASADSPPPESVTSSPMAQIWADVKRLKLQGR